MLPVVTVWDQVPQVVCIVLKELKKYTQTAK